MCGQGGGADRMIIAPGAQALRGARKMVSDMFSGLVISALWHGI